MASRMFNKTALSGQDYPLSVKGITILTATVGLRFAYDKADLADGSKDYFWINAPMGTNTYPNGSFQFDAGDTVFTLWVRPDGDTQINVWTDVGSNTNEIGGVQ